MTIKVFAIIFYVKALAVERSQVVQYCNIQRLAIVQPRGFHVENNAKNFDRHVLLMVNCDGPS
jgi:hypothetical protein